MDPRYAIRALSLWDSTTGINPFDATTEGEESIAATEPVEDLIVSSTGTQDLQRPLRPVEGPATTENARKATQDSLSAGQDASLSVVPPDPPLKPDHIPRFVTYQASNSSLFKAGSACGHDIEQFETKSSQLIFTS